MNERRIENRAFQPTSPSFPADTSCRCDKAYRLTRVTSALTRADKSCDRNTFIVLYYRFHVPIQSWLAQGAHHGRIQTVYERYPETTRETWYTRWEPTSACLCPMNTNMQSFGSLGPGPRRFILDGDSLATQSLYLGGTGVTDVSDSVRKFKFQTCLQIVRGRPCSHCAAGSFRRLPSRERHHIEHDLPLSLVTRISRFTSNTLHNSDKQYSRKQCALQSFE